MTETRTETPGSDPKPRPSPFPVSPGASDAVDRLIAMATEKRADRPLAASSTAQKTGKAMLLPPQSNLPDSSSPSVARKAARALSTLKPLLPALAAALRMVDHGAVQAAARLLPLLAGIPAPASTQAPSGKPGAETAAATGALEAGQEELRKEAEGIRLDLERLEGQLTQVRWKHSQFESEQVALGERLRDLTTRVKFLTYAVILMMPMLLALIVLLVVHLRS